LVQLHRSRWLQNALLLTLLFVLGVSGVYLLTLGPLPHIG